MLTTMQAANRLQKALRTERGLSFGVWQMLPGANLARMMARSGYDWILVDTEHGNIAGIFCLITLALLLGTEVSRRANARGRRRYCCDGC